MLNQKEEQKTRLRVDCEDDIVVSRVKKDMNNFNKMKQIPLFEAK